MNKKKYLPFILVIVIIIVGIYITYITIQPMPYVFMTKWGSYGSMDGQFKNISYITVDFESNVYIADYKNYRIEKFDSSGKFLTKVGSYGSGDGQFKGPFDIAVDTKGYIYNTVFGPLGNIHINDVKRCCIQKFDSSGKFITIWKKDDSIIEIVENKIQTKKLYGKINSCLTDRERKVVEMRYGLSEGKQKTQREIAKILGISRSYVSRIEKKAIKKLHQEFNKG